MLQKRNFCVSSLRHKLMPGGGGATERLLYRSMIGFLCVWLLNACVVSPHERVDAMASDLGFDRKIIDGQFYKHVVYESALHSASRRLHVYVEGDGVAWRYRYLISEDPTPRNPLMLRLMGLDRSSALYLGRPCYFGRAQSDACKPDVWTYSRFSKQVVLSMVRVVQQRARGFDSVVLFGHSGGGALAMLIAEHVTNVEAVVTVAGNLNVDAWVKHHRYSPLRGSLNPATRPKLPVHIRQLHLLGGQDKVVPPGLVADWLDGQANVEQWLVESFDHGCCWDQKWPDVLDWVDSSGNLKSSKL